MIIYNRIAVIAILLLSLLTTSCNTDYTRNHADEIRESITDVVNGLRDGFYDSTVVGYNQRLPWRRLPTPR